MSELAELYQRVVIEHNRNPRHYHVLEPCTHRATGYNPLCGDEVELYLRVEDGVVREAAFQGEGCAIATAAASLLTDVIGGLSIDAVRELIDRVQTLIHEGDDAVDANRFPGDLEVLGVVSRFPGRSKCADLPWKALAAALDGSQSGTVSTERV